ncbi:MAG: electron transport complex subunit RsxC [Thiohalocapsa sp.]|jgi:electron transport complex protein RnfC|uniref:electron transport complex subunit RsxC n=1 Tax=Thiohalocapsa sp. TaxID=2497641 RepID=UPI0025CDFFCE|nr:electron transport complex subunit RsxC [Thiohalocapsa sp.]MCG6942723.1 electron transport complex subunit RsxC [Thiohalocapsa sp.]
MLFPVLNPHRQRLWHFHGGVHLPDEKTLSNGAPSVAAPLPKRLTVPLQQHIGAPADPCVAVGDHVRKGQMLAKPQGYVSAPVHAPSSGTVVAIEHRRVPHPSGLSAPCVVIETDGEDAWAELPAPLPDFEQRDPSELRERIRQSGIVGMGGASFPSSVKLNPGPDQPIATLVINGAECEPYITCDDLLMRERAADIVDGIRVMLHILGTKRCLVGIEDNKPEAIVAMRQAARQGDPAGRISVVEIPTLYPSGGEKQLIKILTGKEVPSHGIPAQIGIVCQNVGTACAVADAVLRGRPLVERLVTVTGRAVAEPRNYRVRIGTSAAELIAASGGFVGEPEKLVVGGPMMGFSVDTDALPITKAANCLLALTAAESPDPGEPQACIRCGRCAEVCPANLLPQQLYWHARSKDLDKVQDYNLFDCIECGCCAHVCPSHIPLVQYYRYAKTESWAREREKRAAEHARERHAAREARLERLERERKAKLRKKKEPVAAAGGADAKQAAIKAARERAAQKRTAPDGASAHSATPAAAKGNGADKTATAGASAVGSPSAEPRRPGGHAASSSPAEQAAASNPPPTPPQQEGPRASAGNA